MTKKEAVAIRHIADSMEIVYTFVIKNYEYYTKAQDYGNGEKMTMVEMHTLSLIADQPGIIVSDVARMWNRTLSAASQNINKLEKKDLIEKRKEPGNKKSLHLYVTDKGQRLSDTHKAFDRRELEALAERFLEQHSMAELETALDVMRAGLELMANRNSAEDEGR